MQNSVIMVTSKNVFFLIVARLANLRQPLYSRRQNKSGGGLGFLFQALVSPECKARQT